MLDVLDHSPAETRAAGLLLLYTGMRSCDGAFAERGYLTARSTFDYWMIKTSRKVDIPPTLHPESGVIEALRALPETRVYFFQPDVADDYQTARHALRHKKDFRAIMPEYEVRVKHFRRLIEGVLRRAKISGAGCCHRFRDTFILNMLIGGTDIFTVAQMVGHRNIATTQGYAKMIPEYAEKMSGATRCLQFRKVS